MEATTLNQAQIELLKAMSFLKTEEDVKALKQAISDFFARKADEEMKRLIETGQWSEEKRESLKSVHLRTPYK